MRSHRLLSLVLVACVAALTSACGSSSGSSIPTAPSGTQSTETYNGTLTVNGAASYPFTVVTAGAVIATLTSITATTAVSLSLGTWNGTSCSISIANDAALLGSAVSGTATVGGSYCVRISDIGTLTEATDYTITVTHF